MKTRARLFIAAAWILAAIPSHGAPSPTSGSGTPGHDNPYTIIGANFGSKISPVDGSAKPYIYVDFEDGTAANVTALATGGAITLGDQNMSIVTEARGSSTKMIKSDSINWALSANGGIVAIDFQMPAASAVRSGKIYKYVKRKASRSDYSHTNSDTGALDMDENWKFDRAWAQTNGSGYPNMYNAQNSESATTCTGGGSRPSPNVEAGSGSNYTATSSNYRLPGPNWMAEERAIRYASANTVGDSLVKIRQDGQLNIDRTNVKTDPSASFPAAGYRRWYTQDDPSNLSDCGGTSVSHDVWYDDVVFDYGAYSWARVMLCNASTLAASTICEFQPATSWATGSITIKQKFGELGTTLDKYIYVWDLDDNVNSTGLLLAVGTGPVPPQLNSVNISTGAPTGGESRTLTGTNFAAGDTVKFGANSATNVNVVNSTTITCDTPAGTPATTVNITVTDTVGQASSLGGAFTYNALPEDPVYVDPNPYRDSGSIPIFRR